MVFVVFQKRELNDENKKEIKERSIISSVVNSRFQMDSLILIDKIIVTIYAKSEQAQNKETEK